jgi:predicted metal-binding protein
VLGGELLPGAVVHQNGDSHGGALMGALPEGSDFIYLSSCLVNAKPGCPYASPEELARILEEKTGVPMVLGTHTYT